MAQLTTGKTWSAGETVTPALLNQMVNSATIANIATADISDDAITAAKLDGTVDLASKSADYTLVLADAGRLINFNSSSNLTLTVPAESTVNFAVGVQIAITRNGTGDVTVAPAANVTIRSSDSRTKIAKQYAAASLIKIGTNEWMLLGLLKA